MVKRQRNFRRKRHAKRRSLLRLPVGSPNQVIRKLRWVGVQGTLNPGAGGICSTTVLKLNSPYDPDASGASYGNKQYNSFDQYCSIDESAGLYRHFVVYSTRVVCQFVNLDASNPQMVGMTVRNTSTGESDYTDYGEGAQSVTKLLGKAGSGQEICTLSLNWSANKYFGRPVGVSIGNQGNSTTAPNQLAYVHIWASGFGTDSGVVMAIPRMDSIIKFSTPVKPSSS